jgi:hypothetical protein
LCHFRERFGSDDVFLQLGVPRRRADRRLIDRQAPRAAEIFKILLACQDHRMVGRKRRRSDGCRASIERLGFAGASCSFDDDREVVQRVGQIRMEWTQFFFLNAGGVSQQLISGRKVASHCGVFRAIEQVTKILMFRHGFKGSGDRARHDSKGQ